MSLPRAFNGETYKTSVRFTSEPSSALRTRRSMQIRNAASVLPEPVGAEISVVRPARISGQPCSCGSDAPCPQNGKGGEGHDLLLLASAIYQDLTAYSRRSDRKHGVGTQERARLLVSLVLPFPGSHAGKKTSDRDVLCAKAPLKSKLHQQLSFVNLQNEID